MEVGQPIANFAVRVVDENDQLQAEGDVGQIQVKGQMVTVGYYERPELNAASFTADGWFNTGDLGFLQNGRLTITGREKDVIIINGINYHSHEIEAFVEELPVVEVSYTAACAVRRSQSNTDEVALFFHAPQAQDDETLRKVLKEVRQQVNKKLSLNPTYLLPVDKETIPKTSIGKIQRSKLRQEFEAGSFANLQKRIDILAENERTLPNWFFKTDWIMSEASLHPNPQAVSTHLFLDGSPLGTALEARLRQEDKPCFVVEFQPGIEAVTVGAERHIFLDGQKFSHMIDLLQILSEDSGLPEQIVYMTATKYPANSTTIVAPAAYQTTCLIPFLHLLQALIQYYPNKRISVLRLLLVTSAAQITPFNTAILPEKSTLLGLLNAANQELAWMQGQSLDLNDDLLDTAVVHILRELQSAYRDREVMYHQSQRYVWRLSPVDFATEQTQKSSFKHGGFYLITGGLGGIGIEIARFLLTQYQARLLILGRTPLPNQIERSPSPADAPGMAQWQAYETLAALPGELHYKAADVANLEQLKEV